MAEIFYPRIAAQQIFYQQDKIHSATARGTSPPATNGSGQRHVKNERNTGRGASPPVVPHRPWCLTARDQRKRPTSRKKRAEHWPRCLTARGASPPATNGSGQRHVKNERNTARGASPPDEWGEIWAFENGLLRKNLMGEKFRFVRSPARWLLYR